MKNIDSTKKIHVDTLLRVYRKGYGYAHMTVVDNTERYFSARTDRDFMDWVEDGDSVECYLWLDNTDSYEFTLEIIGKIDRYSILFFDHTDSISHTKERKCIQAEVEIPVSFFIFTVSDDDPGISTNEIVFHNGTIVELSDREALLKTDVDLPLDGFVKGHSQLAGQETEVVARVDSKSEPGLYRILFEGMSDQERMMILDYVYSIYRE
jgi:hypothetical protein